MLSVDGLIWKDSLFKKHAKENVVFSKEAIKNKVAEINSFEGKQLPLCIEHNDANVIGAWKELSFDDEIEDYSITGIADVYKGNNNQTYYETIRNGWKPSLSISYSVNNIKYNPKANVYYVDDLEIVEASFVTAGKLKDTKISTVSVIEEV